MRPVALFAIPAWIIWLIWTRPGPQAGRCRPRRAGRPAARLLARASALDRHVRADAGQRLVPLRARRADREVRRHRRRARGAQAVRPPAAGRRREPELLHVQPREPGAAGVRRHQRRLGASRRAPTRSCATSRCQVISGAPGRVRQARRAATSSSSSAPGRTRCTARTRRSSSRAARASASTTARPGSASSRASHTHASAPAGALRAYGSVVPHEPRRSMALLTLLSLVALGLALKCRDPRAAALFLPLGMALFGILLGAAADSGLCAALSGARGCRVRDRGYPFRRAAGFRRWGVAGPERFAAVTARGRPALALILFAFELFWRSSQ